MKRTHLAIGPQTLTFKTHSLTWPWRGPLRLFDIDEIYLTPGGTNASAVNYVNASKTKMIPIVATFQANERASGTPMPYSGTYATRPQK